MIHRHRHVKKVIRYFSDFAVHIWIILLLANVLLVYTFHFYLHASSQPEKLSSSLEQQSDINSFADTDQTGEQSQTEEESPLLTVVPEPTDVVPQVPNGPLLGLSFSVPGIGSEGGNLKPIHPTRNVTIYLYPVGVNSSDKKIRPLNTIQTKAYYDANEFSPTYTMFLNPKIDLGAKVEDGDYQIIIKTDKSFRQLIKEKPTNVGGIVFSLERKKEGEEYSLLPPQKMIMGDLFPLNDGDNAVDLNDYAVLINCFQQKRGTPSCPNPRDADINDDGYVDGLDYNVMVLSYGRLQEQGITVPRIDIPPTGTNVSRISYLSPALTKTPPTPAPTFVPDEKKNEGGGGIGGLILFVVFLGMLGGGGFFLYLKNPKVKAMIDGIMHRSPGGKAATPQAQTAAPQQGAAAVPPTSPTDQTLPQSGAASASPAAATPSVESPSSAQTPPPPSSAPADEAKPEEQKPAETSAEPAPAADPGTTPAPPAQSEPAKPAESVAATGPVAPSEPKEYFVKKQSDDETKTGFWLTLTDDNGPTLAHYKGTEVTDGFAQIKGEMKTENGKTFLEVSELTPEA